MEALTWDPESRDPFYANLWAARQEQHVGRRVLGLILAGVPASLR